MAVETVFEVEVIRTAGTATESTGSASVVEVVRPQEDVVETNQVTHIVEVVREHALPIEINRGIKRVDVVNTTAPTGNIGAGPVPPTNPYEGQVWILT